MRSESCWVTEGALPPARSHSRVQAGLCLSFGGPVFSVWKVGVWSEQCLTLEFQEDSLSCVHRARASDGSAASRLRVPVRLEGPRHGLGQFKYHLAKVWALQWGSYGLHFGSLRWPQFQPPGTCNPSLPTAAPGTQPSSATASPRGGQGSRYFCVQRSGLHTCVTDTLVHASARAGGIQTCKRHILGLVGAFDCLHMNALLCRGLPLPRYVCVWQPQPPSFAP